jgi:hypothetical protein
MTVSAPRLLLSGSRKNRTWRDIGSNSERYRGGRWCARAMPRRVRTPSRRAREGAGPDLNPHARPRRVLMRCRGEFSRQAAERAKACLNLDLHARPRSVFTRCRGECSRQAATGAKACCSTSARPATERAHAMARRIRTPSRRAREGAGLDLNPHARPRRVVARCSGEFSRQAAMGAKARCSTSAKAPAGRRRHPRSQDAASCAGRA